MACGPFGKWGDRIVPDKPFGLDLTNACKFHDQAYAKPLGKSKRTIDRLFLAMMLIKAGKNRLHRWIAYTYYWAVSRGHLSWWLCRLKDRWRR